MTSPKSSSKLNSFLRFLELAYRIIALCYVSLFHEDHSTDAHQTFHRCSWYYSAGYLSKKPFGSISPSAESNFEVFGGSFWDMIQYFLKTIQLFHIKLFTDILGITLKVTSTNRSFCSISLSAGSHFEVFWGTHFGAWFFISWISFNSFTPNILQMFLGWLWRLSH